jgi:flagellum-specific peptidoglycan hydrolase FlgJ
MDYDKAEELRKKSFGSLLGEQEGGLGASLKSAISQKTQAKMTGIKEKFDPMNIARAVGGKTGAAVYGKVFGRDQKSMERFAGARKKRISEVGDIGKASGDSSPADVLGLIYRMMLRNAEDDKLQNELKRNKKEEEDKEEEDRNQQLIRALTGRKKPPTKKEKVKEKKPEEEKPTEPPKPTVPKGKGKAPEKPTAKEAPKAPAKEAPKAPAKAPEKPTAAPAPKPAAPTPTAKPSAPAPTVKPSTAAKIAIGAASATGIFSSSDAFSKTMYPYAEKASKGLGGKIPPAAILGQWYGESGGGKNLPSDFNYAGIKAGKNDKKGDYVLTEERYTDSQIKQAEASGETLHKVLGPQDKIKKKGREVTVDEWFGKGSYDKAVSEGKKWVQVKSYFAKFDNFDDFTNRYISFLSSPRYAKARESTTPAQFGSEVAKAGYATASADKYSAKVASFAESFNNSGNQIDSSSKENKDLKNTENDKAAPTVINNNTNTQQNSTNKPKRQEEDDRSAYQKKTQG